SPVWIAEVQGAQSNLPEGLSAYFGAPASVAGGAESGLGADCPASASPGAVAGRPGASAPAGAAPAAPGVSSTHSPSASRFASGSSSTTPASQGSTTGRSYSGAGPGGSCGRQAQASANALDRNKA